MFWQNYVHDRSWAQQSPLLQHFTGAVCFHRSTHFAMLLIGLFKGTVFHHGRGAPKSGTAKGGRPWRGSVKIEPGFSRFFFLTRKKTRKKPG